MYKIILKTQSHQKQDCKSQKQLKCAEIAMLNADIGIHYIFMVPITFVTFMIGVRCT